jgi:hypothetical protein
MRLALIVHWTPDGDLDPLCDALRPLKAEGTAGHIFCYDEGDPSGDELYAMLRDLAENAAEEGGEGRQV